MDWSDCVEGANQVATINCVPIMIMALINSALAFAGFTAVAFIIVAGYQMLTSGGDPKKVAGARGTLTYTIIGLVVVLLSFFILNFIAFTTGVQCIQMIGFTNC